jgi:DNA adenine methylase
MSAPPLVPPIKCQGIKTKLVEEIRALATMQGYERWVEPFCGSCVVPLNLQPQRALLCDSNVHIIRLYQDIQAGRLTAPMAKAFLTEEGEKLRTCGEDYFYEVRERFNTSPSSLDFLFLNRSCFNGVMRFNRSGKFNVPFCRKPDRFAAQYVSKITNQLRRIGEVIANKDWTFEAADFRATMAKVEPGDFVYADPPYAGRHVDYFNSWSEQDENDLAELLKGLPCKFILSTWHSNFYHVGSTEDLRHPMTEALVTNLSGVRYTTAQPAVEQMAFLEKLAGGDGSPIPKANRNRKREGETPVRTPHTGRPAPGPDSPPACPR